MQMVELRRCQGDSLGLLYSNGMGAAPEVPSVDAPRVPRSRVRSGVGRTQVPVMALGHSPESAERSTAAV